MSNYVLPVEQLYVRYMQEMEQRWSPASVRSERVRLNQLPFPMPYAEVYRRVLGIPQEDLRLMALTLLRGGLRFSEIFAFQPDGTVIGKGSKIRRVYVSPPEGITFTRSRYSSLLRALKKVGIPSPHKLRHAKMSSVIENGMNVFELTKFAGWASVETAQSYVNARDEEIARKAMADEPDFAMAGIA
jgi:integrase